MIKAEFLIVRCCGCLDSKTIAFPTNPLLVDEILKGEIEKKKIN